MDGWLRSIGFRREIGSLAGACRRMRFVFFATTVMNPEIISTGSAPSLSISGQLLRIDVVFLQLEPGILI